jgi:DNA-binding HxlR family transcriptional regulator
VSEKMLSQQLKELESDGLILKNVISMKPYRVEYYLTEDGKSLAPMYDFLMNWGKGYLNKREIKIDEKLSA